FSVNHFTREITVSDELCVSENELKRAIVHEIEAHIYRSLNGAIQPYMIFSKGLSKETTETDEGLAVYVEKAQGVNLESQLKNYAGRVIAIHTAQKKSFYETFEEMRKYFSEEDAYYLTLRAKRGTYDLGAGGAFVKDALYLKGMVSVEEFLKERQVWELYMGKYAISDTPLVLDVDGLKKPKYLPGFASIKKK
ncbi:MAG: tyrosine/phenylalanine carboxypeptidase domain-containing protein, partial [archaeon]